MPKTDVIMADPDAGNNMWELLPASVISDVVQKLDNSELLAASSTCRAWRAAVASSLRSLAPKSVLAMPFIGRCSSLKRLQLGQAVPATIPGPFCGFSHITAAPGLTNLSLAISSTATWQASAAALHATQLTCLTALEMLQVLDLSGQPLLQQSGALNPVALLPSLVSLSLKLTGTGLHLPASTWAVLARLTGLTELDVSGCARCYQDRSSSSGGSMILQQQQQQSEAEWSVGQEKEDDEERGLLAAGGLRLKVTDLTAAPLQLLSSLQKLQRLVMADWLETPAPAGFDTIRQLPALSFLDLSHLHGGGSSSSSHVSAHRQGRQLLQLLHGSRTAHQQQQEQQSLDVQLRHASGTAEHRQQQQQQQQTLDLQSAAGSVAVKPSQLFFPQLSQLVCVYTPLLFSQGLWAALPGLTALNLSGSERFSGQGLTMLTRLQQLVLSGCHQLDYDHMTELLSLSTTLKHLDLQRSTVILNGSGRVGLQLQQGRYKPPQLLDKQQRKLAAAAAALMLSGSSNSRRDIALSSSSSVDSTSGLAATAVAAGLEVLVMSECGLALEGLAWHSLPRNPNTPCDPSLLLLDLVLQSQQQLRSLRVLHWGRGTNLLVDKVLGLVVPAASKTLNSLNLSGSCLPTDPSKCWQGLAAATALNRLDLSHVGFSQRGFANPCGVNPTVALLRCVAGMKRLQVLNLAGWRFYFANFHVLAGLTGLASMDLTAARDVDGSTLWRLTHLTGLTKLSLTGAAPSNPHIWSLVFAHLTLLRHLDLSNCTNFTSSSVSGLVQLSGLTSLDLRGTAAGDEAAVRQLVKLSCCRRLALSLSAVPDAAAFAIAQQQQQQQQQALARGKPSEHHHAHRLQFHNEQQQQQQQERRRSIDGPGNSSSIASSSSISLSANNSTSSTSGSGQLVSQEGYAFLGMLGKCQSLRRVELGAGPAVAEYCRRLLPPWIEVR